MKIYMAAICLMAFLGCTKETYETCQSDHSSCSSDSDCFEMTDAKGNMGLESANFLNCIRENNVDAMPDSALSKFASVKKPEGSLPKCIEKKCAYALPVKK